MNDDPGGDMSDANDRPRSPGPTHDAGHAGEHDPWLREALRHAPDATLAPPTALREAIFAEARSATRPRAARNTSPGATAIAFWDWLARPAVAAGFASVMAATIVGLMWWDRPMDEAMLQPPGRAQPLPAVRPSLPLAPSSEPSTRPAPAAPTAPAALAAPAAPARQAEPAPLATADSRARSEASPRAKRETTNEPRAVIAAKPAPTARTDASGRTQRPPAGEAATPFPLPAPTDQRRDASSDRALPATVEKFEPTRPAASPAPARAAAQDNFAPSAFAGAQKAATAPALRRERAAGAGATAAAESDASSNSAGGQARPVASLLAVIDQAPRRWRRAGASATETGLDPATRHWLESVETAAAGRWQEAADRSDALQAGSADDDSTLLFERDGRTAAALHLEADGIRLVTPTGNRFATLPSETLERLRKTLPPAR